MKSLVALSCLFFLLAGVSRSAGNERILYFHSDITVFEDSSMAVREVIRVHATGDQIRHGIYRDFPTRYRDRYGNRYRVGFKVVKALRDGSPEEYHLQDLSNGIRIYLGKKSETVPPGDYTYTLFYTTTRQIGFFKDHDELYWNVTGNGWSFAMDEASATVVLPQGISNEKISLNGYTGPQGSQATNFTSSIDESAKITFSTTRPLSPGEGLTIVVAWPKGVLVEPSRADRLTYLFQDNPSAAVGVLGLTLLLFYYWSVWARVGRDPAKGTIIPLYSPPDRFSPSATRYVVRMGYDDKTFASAVVSMAVKGFLSIAENSGTYTLTRGKADKTVLSPEEQIIASKLLTSSDTIELKQANHAAISDTMGSVKNSLKMHYEKTYFLTNRQYFVPGVVVSIILLALTGLASSRSERAAIALFASFWLSIWSLGVTFLVWEAITLWKQALFGTEHKPASLAAATSMSLFSLPFIAGEIAGLGLLAFATSPLVVLILAALVFVNFLFYHLLKAPTLAGRNLMDEIEGFRMFLSVTEGDRLNLVSPPEKTPLLFEKYLPYALALDVEHSWAQQFSEILSSAGEGQAGYAPGWYSGSSWNSMGASGFAGSLGSSLCTAISSSSTAPGSSSGSSGFGGGGSSGGGGGGGGGGGW